MAHVAQTPADVHGRTGALGGAVVVLLARGAALHMAVGAGTVAWDWWRQQRRRAALVVPAPARAVVRTLPLTGR